MPQDSREYRNKIEAQGVSVMEHAACDTYEAVVEDDEDHMDEDAVWLREQRLFNMSLHWLHRPSVVMLGVCLFLFTFATLSAESTRQMITFKLACNAVLDKHGSCDPLETQVLVSNLQQFYAFSIGLTTIFALGKIGPLSDQYGRKLFMIFIVLCNLLGKSSKFWIMWTFPLLRFSLMVATEVMSNLCGGVVAFMTLASCYVSDISETHQRIYYLGINMAALFIGFSTGPLLGNLLIAHGSVALAEGLPSTLSSISAHEFLPLKVELALFSFLAAFMVFVLPELRSDKARRKSRSLSRSSLAASLPQDLPPEPNAPSSKFFDTFNFLSPIRLVFYPKDSVPRLRHHGIDTYRVVVVILVLADCIMTSIAIPMGEIYVLYGIFRFDWTAQNLGTFLAVTCSSRAFVLIILSPLISHQLLQKWGGLQVHKRQFDSVDYSMISLAFLFEIVGMGLVALASNGTFYLASLVFSSFSTLAGPALNSSIVKFYPELKTGELFGGMALIKNFFQIVTPVLMLAIYKRSLAKWLFPQMVFIFVALCFTVFWISVSYARYVLAKHTDQENLSRASSSTLLLLPASPSHPSPNQRRPLHSRNASFSV